MKRGKVCPPGCNCKRHSVQTRERQSTFRMGNKFASRHGDCNSPTYNSWHAMIKRGRGQHINPAYQNVEVCSRWEPRKGGSYQNFLEDMGHRPQGTTLGRFGDKGNYEPGNCAWMTPKEQASNFRPDRPLGGRKCEPGCTCKRHNHKRRAG